MYLKEIHLLSDDIVETERFYASELDFIIESRDDRFIAFIVGETKLVFNKSEGLAPYYHMAFDIPANKLEEAYHWIKKSAPIIPVTPGNDFSDFSSWNARSFYFYDKNGNVLEFICRYAMNYQSKHPFGSSSILYVSEIGIVTENVPALSEQLIRQFNIEIFTRQPRQNNFTVLGKDTGLFIIVQKDKAWFPTSKPAKPFWTKIIFTSKEKMYEVILD